MWSSRRMACGWQLDTGLSGVDLKKIVDGCAFVTGWIGAQRVIRRFDVETGRYLGQEADQPIPNLGRLGHLDHDPNGLTLTVPGGARSSLALEFVGRISTNSLWSRPEPIVALTEEELVVVDVAGSELRVRWRKPVAFDVCAWCSTGPVLWLAEPRLDDRTILRAYDWRDGALVREAEVPYAVHFLSATDELLVATTHVEQRECAVALALPELNVAGAFPARAARPWPLGDCVVTGDGHLAVPRLMSAQVEWATVPVPLNVYPKICGSDALFTSESTLARIDTQLLRTGANDLDLKPIDWTPPQVNDPRRRPATVKSMGQILATIEVPEVGDIDLFVSHEEERLEPGMTLSVLLGESADQPGPMIRSWSITGGGTRPRRWSHLAKIPGAQLPPVVPAEPEMDWSKQLDDLSKAAGDRDRAVARFRKIADRRLLDDLARLGIWFKSGLKSPREWHFDADSDEWQAIKAKKLTPFAEEEGDYTHCFLEGHRILSCHRKDSGFWTTEDFMTWLCERVSRHCDDPISRLEHERTTRVLKQLQKV